MHNFYTYLYNKTVFDLLTEERGAGEAVLFARSATSGGQQFPVHWGGDCNSNFESMVESLRGGLSLCLFGFGFWSHDIGGFEGMPPAAVYKRWVAFGLLSSHSCLHGNSSYRVPWVYEGDEAVDVLRLFTNLKCRLMPYLFAAAVDAHQTGTPVMRAMMPEFPGDPACDTLDREYMLGSNLLVAPVFSEDGVVNYYVPEGRWTHFLTGETVRGPRWARETHGFRSLPLLARPHSVVAVGANAERPDYDFADGVTFHVYELADGGPDIETVVPALDGTPALTLTVSRTGRRVQARAGGKTDNWHLLLVNVNGSASVEGGTGESTDGGLLVTPVSGATAVSIVLAERNPPPSPPEAGGV